MFHNRNLYCNAVIYRKDIGPQIATILDNIRVFVTFGSIKRAQYTSLQHFLLVLLRELTT